MAGDRVFSQLNELARSCKWFWSNKCFFFKKTSLKMARKRYHPAGVVLAYLSLHQRDFRNDWPLRFIGRLLYSSNLGVSKNRGTPKSSILIGFSLINHPFWGTPIFGNTQMVPFQGAMLKLGGCSDLGDATFLESPPPIDEIIKHA